MLCTIKVHGITDITIAMKHPQKIYFLISVLFAALLGCQEIKEKLLPSFDYTVPVIKVTVPPIPFVPEKEMTIGALSTRINLDSTIKAKTAGTFSAASVTSIKLQKIAIKALNATQDNSLSNFESARIRIYSDSSSTDIAAITFPTTFTDSLMIVPTAHPQLKQFLMGSHLSYNIFWKNRKPSTKRLKLTMAITVSIQ